MATIFTEGFDKYGAPNTGAVVGALLIQGEWTSYAIGGFSSDMATVPPLSATGYALGLGQATDEVGHIVKTLPGNYSRLIAGFRFSNNLSGTAGGIVFLDVTTAQCSVTVNTTGTISIRTGTSNGTVIATSTASISANTVHYLEVDITFGTAGAYQVWLDGLSILSGTAATKVTANSYANVLMLGSTGGGDVFFMTYDDFYLFDTTTAHNNAALLTSPRIETRFPNSDAQTQFTNVATILGSAYSSTGSADAPGANQLFLRKFTSTVNQTIASVSCVPQTTAGAAKFKAVIYADSAGSPGSLLSSGTEVIGTTTNVTLTGLLVTPQSLIAATPYWIGFIGDTSIPLLKETDTLTSGQKAANTYTSGAPGSAPTMTSNLANWNMWGNCTGAVTNFEAVNQNPAPGDISSIASSTPDQEDLYGFPALTTSSSNIYTVAVKANVKRSDTGARTIDFRLKSSATDSAGSNAGQTSGTSYGWLGSYFDLDPNGNITWTYGAVNAAVAGPKVAS